jgi:dipeptidyl-peptidase-4
MKNLLRKLLLLVFPGISLLSAEAQLKALTASQLLDGHTDGLVKPLPVILGWSDDSHYILKRGKDTLVINAANGKEMPYADHSRMSLYMKSGDIYIKASGLEKRLTDTKEEEKNPAFSPDSSKVAFTRNNDLFVIDITTLREQRLTNDGSNVVYNGWASWVYYEEILGRSSHYRAFWWSPDSRRIAYMRFDDSKVPVFPLFSAMGQHGDVEETRYPEAGDPNPEVRVGIADITTAKTTWSDFNEHDDQYFGTPFWTPDGAALWVQWMNRHQNHLIVYAIDPLTGTKRPVYDEEQGTWVNWLGDIHFLPNNKGYLIQSDKSGWMHIYHYDMNGRLVKQLTNGNWAVTKLLHVDEKKGIVYFSARKENSTRIDLYQIKMDGTDLKRLTFGAFYNTVSLSPAASYFITTYSNVDTPPRMALMTNKGKIIRQIADSKGDDLGHYRLAKTELVRVATPDGFQLPVLITWPPDLDSNKKYPVLISIYGGPNAGTVYDRWQGLGETQWWAREGLVQVQIDHRGSGHFGKAGQNYLYKNLGDWEIRDYSDVVKWLTAMKFIDPTKVCITGFSYGGYITCLALTRGADYFNYGIAGGSVTDWHLYDTHYTERYMGLPSEDSAGYQKSSVMHYVNRYKGNLLLVHGTMDDNVHMQNSIQLIAALEDHDKHFEFLPYPGGRHGWRNLPARWEQFDHEKILYYYKYLLERPVPADLLQ